MTDSTPDERRPSRRNDDEPEVEAHRYAVSPSEQESERRPSHRNDDEEGPDVEGHRFSR
jgi:hypothetical protein